MQEIKEQPKEDKSSSISEQSFPSKRIPKIEQKEINPQIDQEEYYQDIIVSQFESLTKGDFSIFTIYRKPDESTLTEQNKQVLNILKLHPDDEDSKKSPFDKTLDGMPTCVQDLMNHPTLTDPSYSRFRNFVKHNQASIFDSIFFYPNW